MVKKLFAFLLTLTMTSSSLVVADTEVNEYSADSNTIIENAWVQLDGSYDYPITALDSEWDALVSVEDMRSVTQIPNSILHKISTEELLELILDYSLLCDIHAYDSIEDGYYQIKNQFNGISEMLDREDSIVVLLNAYKAYNIPRQKILDYTSIMSGDDYIENYNNFIHNPENHELIYRDAAVYETIDILEMLLKDVLESKGSSNDMNRFAEAYAVKLEQKNKSTYYKTTNPVQVLQLIQEEEGQLYTALFEENSYAIETVNNNYVISTPGGNTATCIYDTNFEYADPSTYSSLIAKYHASQVSIASKTFNCHSFAWLQDLYPNTYQYLTLLSVGPFTSDPSYEKSSTAKIGWIVLYSQHSGIVTQTGMDYPYDTVNYPEAYIISKWGSEPIVAHYEKHNPYYSSGQNLKYYHLK